MDSLAEKLQEFFLHSAPVAAYGLGVGLVRSPLIGTNAELVLRIRYAAKNILADTTNYSSGKSLGFTLNEVEQLSQVYVALQDDLSQKRFTEGAIEKTRQLPGLLYAVAGFHTENLRVNSELKDQIEAKLEAATQQYRRATRLNDYDALLTMHELDVRHLFQDEIGQKDPFPQHKDNVASLQRKRMEVKFTQAIKRNREEGYVSAFGFLVSPDALDIMDKRLSETTSKIDQSARARTLIHDLADGVSDILNPDGPRRLPARRQPDNHNVIALSRRVAAHG